MNGTGQNVFCASGCELTFQYGGFTPTSAGALPGTPGTVINYTGGFVNVYADATPEITNPSDPTTLTSANTGDGSALARPARPQLPGLDPHRHDARYRRAGQRPERY